MIHLLPMIPRLHPPPTCSSSHHTYLTLPHHNLQPLFLLRFLLLLLPLLPHLFSALHSFKLQIAICRELTPSRSINSTSSAPSEISLFTNSRKRVHRSRTRNLLTNHSSFSGTRRVPPKKLAINPFFTAVTQGKLCLRL